MSANHPGRPEFAKLWLITLKNIPVPLSLFGNLTGLPVTQWMRVKLNGYSKQKIIAKIITPERIYPPKITL